MRILIVGDLHLKANRLKDVAEAWGKTIGWAQKNNVDVVLQAGDVFHKPNIFGREADVGTIFSAFLNPFKDYEDRNVFLIPGNHDMGGPRNDDALSAFNEHSWIKVCHRPDVVELLPGLSVCAVPWVNRAKLTAKLVDKGMNTKDANKKASEALSTLLDKLTLGVKQHQDKGNFVLFMGHLEITGASRDGGDKQTNGLFEFSPSQLGNVGADAYALAHIHVRQPISGLPNKNDGYLGSLCQLSFGEQNNETGFRYIDIEDGKIVKDKFVNNTSSPCYHTVSDMEGLKYNQDIDYVKLRGKVRPDELPDRVKFEKMADDGAVKRRIEEEVNSNTSVTELLKIWSRETKCQVPLGDLVNAAEQISKKTDVPEEAIGSLELIERISLKNITSHESTEIDLKDLRGVHGVEGQNGSGKTTVLEAFLIALYGYCPSRPSLQDIIRNRSDVKDASIEVDFVSNGRKLTARREFHKTSKTFRHDAFLYETSKGKKEPLAGPKVADVKNLASILVGDLKMVLTGTFSAQSEMDNIVNLDRKDRMEMWAKLLGSDKFIAMGKVASDESKGDNATRDACMARIESLRIDLANEGKDKKNYKDCQAKAKDGRTKLDKTSNDLGDCRALLAVGDKVRAEIEEKTHQIENFKLEQVRLKDEAISLNEEKKTLDSVDVKAIEMEFSKIQQIEVKVEKAKLKISEAEKASAEKNAAASKLQSEIEIRKASLKDAYAKQVAEHESKIKKAEDQRSPRRKQMQSKMDSITTEIQEAKVLLEASKRQYGLLEGFPDVEACSQCPLAKDGLLARKRAADANRSIKRLEEQKNKGTEVIEKYDLDTQKLIDSVGELPIETDVNTDKTILSLKDKIVTLKEEAKTLLPTGNFQEKFGAAMKELERLPEVEKKLEKARSARSEADKVSERIVLKKERYKEIEGDIAKIKIPEEIDDSKHQETKKNLETVLENIKSDVEELVLEVGRVEARLGEHNRNKKKLSELAGEIDKLEVMVAANNALAQAFGRNGIPQLIVDSTIPHFQDILLDLIKEFDGRWSMQICSQKETKKGAVQEVIDILVDDGYGPRDIKTYSGGEKQLLKTIIRIAFATLQAERSGQGLKVLILDEATGAMDPELAEQFVRMLGRLSDAFNQVFIVSHNDQVLSTLSNRIVFSLKDGVTQTFLSSL